MNVLISGGAGFVGAHLAEIMVANGDTVTVLDNFDTGTRDNLASIAKDINLIQADVRSTDWFSQVSSLNIDEVYHLAANASVPKSSDDPLYDASTNILGTVNLLEIAKAQNAKFILASSAAVYGAPLEVPISESHPTGPISHYGVSKLSAEYYVQLYQQRGLDTRIIRYFNIFGPRQPRYVVFDFFRKALMDVPTFEILGDGSQRRTEMYISDAVAATVHVARSDVSGAVNVGADKVYSIEDIARSILKTCNRAKTLFYTNESWPGDIMRLEPALEKLHAIGFYPQVTFEDGIKEVATWWLANSALE